LDCFKEGLVARFIRLIAPLAILICSAVLPAAAEATFAGKNGKIAFGTQRAPDDPYRFDTEAINPDGTALQSLISNGGMARWSPDGTKLAFRSPDFHTCCNHASELYIANADGTSVAQLSHFNLGPGHLADVFAIAWSPDGTRIAVEVHDYRRSNNIYVVNRDGSALTTIATNASDPTWSPDSREVAFQSLASTGSGIGVVNADGTSLRMLSDDGVLPDWSPGTRIAFARPTPSDVPAPGTELWTMNPDGSGQRLLASFPYPAGLFPPYGSPPEWSPDATKIIFSDHVLRADGSILASVVERAVWSPDSKKIAFVDLSQAPTSEIPFPENVYVENADASGQVMLTHRPQRYEVTDWQPIPAPRRAAFKNANQFCKAEQAFWGDQFSQRYRNFGQCVSRN
jgi:Tol biopolymer transport system component